MKRLTVTLIGTVTRGATRSFVVEVPDDVDAATLDLQVLEDMADEAHIAWDFDVESFVQVSDHETEVAEQNVELPVIAFKKPDERVNTST